RLPQRVLSELPLLPRVLPTNGPRPLPQPQVWAQDCLERGSEHMVADLEILGWLHDSELLSIDVTMEDGERHLTLLVHGDDEMGFENWGGSVFRLVFNEVDLLEL